MGANLSFVNPIDKSGIVFNQPDQTAAFILLGMWAGVLYVCAMIFSTCVLIDRWRGPHDKVQTGPGSVLAAFMISAAWPIVMAYIIANK